MNDETVNLDPDGVAADVAIPSDSDAPEAQDPTAPAPGSVEATGPEGDAEDVADVDDSDVADDEDSDDGDSDDEDADDEGTSAPQGSKKRQALENEGEVAADYLEELLDIADLDGDIDTFVEAGRARVSIITDQDTLVGRDGEVLDALQELCRLAVMTQTGKRSRLMLDIAGHRDKRRKELEAMAQDAVVEVKESMEPVRLAPMNPFERKIVHDVVAKAGLVSESEGQEPNRRVVVLPA